MMSSVLMMDAKQAVKTTPAPEKKVEWKANLNHTILQQIIRNKSDKTLLLLYLFP